MSCDDSVKDENKEDIVIDIDNIKRQLMAEEMKCLEKQQQSGINENENTYQKLPIDEQELRANICNDDYVEYLIQIVKKTVKCEDSLIRQILYTGLSSYIRDDPINLGIMAPTSEGKTYPVEECIKFFPREDVYKVGSMSAKTLVRDKGMLVDKNLNPIEDKLRELKKKAKRLSKKNQQDEKENIDEEIEKLYKDAKTLIDLRAKILVFLEPPDKEVWAILKPILSHDSFEIEYPFVNQTDKDGHETKKVVVRGWPSCIFCSSRDESKWEMWSEIKSRFLTSSPNMIPQKYQESTKLIALRKGLPNLIQQQTIISDNEINLAKQCILLIKQKINDLRIKINNTNGKISVWIPYAQLLQKELPANKGTDVRLVKRIFSLLNIVPIVKLNLRNLLVLENEISIIADLQDLREVLSITQSVEGIPQYKIDFINNIFYPLYNSKTKPDSNSDGSKHEDSKGVTVRQLCEYFKDKEGKSISTDNMKKTYLNELINNGLIDYETSKIDSRQYIYYPLIEPLYNTASVTFNNNYIENISSLPNLNRFDNFSQLHSVIYEKIIKNINEIWLFSEIMMLLTYRIEFAKVREPLADYLNNHEKFQLLNNNNNVGKEEHNQSMVSEYTLKEISNSEKETVPKCCCNSINNNTNGRRLSIKQFIKKYVEIPKNLFDIKEESEVTSFGKISPILSNLPQFDVKDI
jgi:hypothetical protein